MNQSHLHHTVSHLAEMQEKIYSCREQYCTSAECKKILSAWKNVHFGTKDALRKLLIKQTKQFTEQIITNREG